MSKNYTLTGLAASVEFAKNGGALVHDDGDDSFGFFTDEGAGTLSRVRGADATAANDFVTLQQLTTASPLNTRSVEWDDTDFGAPATSLPIEATVLPAGAIVAEAWLTVTTAITTAGAAGTLEIGVAGTTDLIMTPAEMDVSINTYETGKMYESGAGGLGLLLTNGADAFTAGAGEAVVVYFEP